MQNRIASISVPARVPPGVSIVAFGDVHGYLDEMETILRKVQARAARKPERRHIIISLGDLVDRGPDPRGVVSRVMGQVPGCELIVIRGNHETLMMAFLDGDEEANPWLEWGGLATLRSYGVNTSGVDIGSKADVENLRTQFRARMEPDHLEFLRTRPLNVTFGDYFFVHAGVRPGVPLQLQKEHDLIWIRDEFLNSRQYLGKKIVHGHTSVEKAEFLDNRINLDTGACYGGALTAALFEDDRAHVFESVPAYVAA